MARSRRPLYALLALALALTTAACAGDDEAAEQVTDEATDEAAAEIPQTVVEASDFAFTVPDGIAAGVNEIVLRNNGDEPHHLQLARLNDGVTAEQFQAELKKGPQAALPLITVAGGAMTAAPGGESSAIVRLEEGQHVALCFIESPDEVPHLAKGMVQPFSVAAAEGEGAAAPEADATVGLMDFAFEVPELTAGEVTLAFENRGEQPHEAAIVAIPADKVASVDAWFADPSGPPPFEPGPMVGIQALAPDTTGWARTTLEPGAYAFVCFVPDLQSGKPHFQLGMAKRVDVT